MTLDEATETLLDLFPQVFAVLAESDVPVAGSAAKPTRRQEQVLALIESLPGASLSTLADRMKVSPSALCLLLDRMERGGLARRERSASDRRSVGVRLTVRGAEMLRRQRALDRNGAQRLLAWLSPDEREHALYGLWLLSQAASRMSAARAESD